MVDTVLETMGLAHVNSTEEFPACRRFSWLAGWLAGWLCGSSCDGMLNAAAANATGSGVEDCAGDQETAGLAHVKSTKVELYCSINGWHGRSQPC